MGKRLIRFICMRPFRLNEPHLFAVFPCLKQAGHSHGPQIRVLGRNAFLVFGTRLAALCPLCADKRRQNAVTRAVGKHIGMNRVESVGCQLPTGDRLNDVVFRMGV